jgi:UDPglucose 6-dehydrogenase
MVEKIRAALGGELRGRTLAVLGLSFKPETDDVRESPAVDIARALAREGVRLRAYDPEAMRAAHAVLPDLELCKDAYEACVDADAVVIITEWNQFRMLDLERVRGLLRQPLMIDLRNIYQPSQMAEAGFHYVSVGRESVGVPFEQ